MDILLKWMWRGCTRPLYRRFMEVQSVLLICHFGSLIKSSVVYYVRLDSIPSPSLENRTAFWTLACSLTSVCSRSFVLHVTGTQILRWSITQSSATSAGGTVSCKSSRTAVTARGPQPWTGFPVSETSGLNPNMRTTASIQVCGKSDACHAFCLSRCHKYRLVSSHVAHCVLILNSSCTCASFIQSWSMSFGSVPLKHRTIWNRDSVRILRHGLWLFCSSSWALSRWYMSWLVILPLRPSTLLHFHWVSIVFPNARCHSLYVGIRYCKSIVLPYIYKYHHDAREPSKGLNS